MKLIPAFLAAVFLLASPFAHAEGARGSCQLANAAGVAQLKLNGAKGEITGVTGVSPIVSASRSSAGAFETISIRYLSQLAASQGGHDAVEVQLVLLPSPMTALAGVNYQGVLLYPISVMGLMPPLPFSSMPSGWLNPFGPFTPVPVPAGFAVLAAAYCDFQ